MRWGVAIGGALLLAVFGLPGSQTADAADERGVNHVYETPSSPYRSSDPVVAITFDDGPNATYTPQVLDILGRYGAQATFFELGQEVAARPQLSQRIVSEGHAVAGHTWSHVDLTRLPSSQWPHQIGDTTAAIESATRQKVVCTRPPNGASNAGVVDRLRQYGQASVVWTADTHDFQRPGVSTIVNRALSGLHNGSIILMHDGGGDRSQTVAALPSIIEGIRARGYRLVPICGGSSLGNGAGLASSGDGRLDLAVREAGGQVLIRNQTVRTGAWSPWMGTGGYGTSDPDLASWAAGRLDVVVRGPDGAVWHEGFQDGQAFGWRSLGGGFKSGPSIVAPAPGRLAVFARGNDDALWVNAWNGAGWGGWWKLGGDLMTDPDAAAWGGGRIDVFAGGRDGALWHIAFDGAKWLGWDRVGGAVTSAPTAASPAPQRLDILVRGSDGALWATKWTGTGWAPWYSLGGVITSSPDATSRAPARVDVVVRGADGALFSRSSVDGAWAGWVRLP